MMIYLFKKINLITNKNIKFMFGILKQENGRWKPVVSNNQKIQFYNVNDAKKYMDYLYKKNNYNDNNVKPTRYFVAEME